MLNFCDFIQVFVLPEITTLKLQDIEVRTEVHVKYSKSIMYGEPIEEIRLDFWPNFSLLCLQFTSDNEKKLNLHCFDKEVLSSLNKGEKYIIISHPMQNRQA